MKKSINLLLFCLLHLLAHAQINYYSLNGASNFSNPSSWTTDATGALSIAPPTALSAADNYTILAGATMTLNANATVRQLTNNGTLNIATYTLNIEQTTGNKAVFSNSANSILNISSGAIRIKGSVTMAGRFIQTGGDLFIDGNSGTTGSLTNPSVALLNITSTQALEVTGGSWTFPDPSGNTVTTNGSSECIYYNTATCSLIPATHTIKLGDGISTQAGGNTNGFRVNLNVAVGGRLHLGSLVFNSLVGTNRFSTFATPPAFTGDITVISGECRINQTTYIGGSIAVNSGATLTCTGSVYMVNSALGFGAGNLFSSNPVSITNNGTIRSYISPPANSPNLFVLYVGNSHPLGLTLNSPLRVGNFGWANVNGEFKGIVNTSNTNYLRLVNTSGVGVVNSAMYDTAGASGDADAYIKGPFEITIGTSFSDVNNTITFPVGLNQFTPLRLFEISAAPSAVTTIRVSPKNGNFGTLATGLTNLSTNNCELSFVGANGMPSSGIKIGIGASNISGSNVVVSSVSLNGQYTLSGGACNFIAASTATYGTNFSNGTNLIASSNLAAHYSYAETTQIPICAAITKPIAGTTVEVNPFIKWTTAQGATNYDLYLSTNSPAYNANNPNANLIGNFATTSYEITSANTLLPNTTYYVFALAKNANGVATSCAESSFITGTYVRYCAPTFNQFGCSEGDVIARVQLNTLDNNSGTSCAVSTLGYTDYRGLTTTNPNLTTTLTAGSTYQCTIWAGRVAQSYAAWIDFDDNGQFEASERIGFTSSAVAGSGQSGVIGSAAIFTLSLPCNIPSGLRTMRVRGAFNTAGSSIVPCGPGNGTLNGFGEAEDYLVNIVCPTLTTIGLENVTPTTATYKWKSSCANMSYDIYLGNLTPNAITIPTFAGILDTFIHLNGLTPNSFHNIWIRSACNNALWYSDGFSTPSLPTLNIKLNLSGYNGNANFPNKNNDYIKTLADFPMSDPYAVAPFNATFIHYPPRNAAIVPSSVLAATGNASIVDWIWLELRAGNAGSTTLKHTAVGLLRADGQVVNPSDGVSAVQFPNIVAGNYFVVVRHRNHLSFATATAIPISTNTALIDFTANPQNIYGYIAGQQEPLTQIAPNIYAMIGGDANVDDSIDAFDSIQWETQNGLFDNYINNADYNMDGSIDAFDSITWELHNGKFAIIP